jgi:two-component system chemotaxis response regulator CheB
VVIGTSTGGPIALRQVLPAIPADFPVPLLIVQHMPPQYTCSLAKRLNEASALEVVEAADGMTVEPGFAYIAPGGWHMKVERQGGRASIRTTQDPPENSCRPAVDYLFRSAADAFAGAVLAVVLTGMGRDGAAGCREIKNRGGYVMAQDAEGCVVYGMPKVVVEEKLADCVVPLEQIASAVVSRVQRSRERSKG